jgi:hypothetical protein
VHGFGQPHHLANAGLVVVTLLDGEHEVVAINMVTQVDAPHSKYSCRRIDVCHVTMSLRLAFMSFLDWEKFRVKLMCTFRAHPYFPQFMCIRRAPTVWNHALRFGTLASQRDAHL